MLQCHRTNKNPFEYVSSIKTPYFCLLAILAREGKNTARKKKIELEFQVSGLSLHTATLAHFKPRMTFYNLLTTPVSFQGETTY